VALIYLKEAPPEGLRKWGGRMVPQRSHKNLVRGAMFIFRVFRGFNLPFQGKEPKSTPGMGPCG
jgi:hypothetical protein